MQFLIETDGLQTIVLTGLVRIFGDLAVEISKGAYRWIVKRIKQAVSKGRASKKRRPSQCKSIDIKAPGALW
jgi:hypothetical protein